MHLFATQTAAGRSAKSDRSGPLAPDKSSLLRERAFSPATAPRTQVGPATRLSPASFIQPKLVVNRPGDTFEREADRVADLVVRSVSGPPATLPAIQRKCAACEKEEADKTSSAGDRFRQAVRPEAEEETPFTQHIVFRKATSTGGSFPVNGAAPITLRSSGGEPLPAETRSTMEHSFGHDFSRVRIHRDGDADRLNRQLGALAFTHGRDIYFGNGRYDPDGTTGRRLLAHELTHVVQQGHASQTGTAGSWAPVGPAAAPVPAIQCFALWRAGPVTEDRNLAHEIATQGAAGFTPPVLNGSVILSTAQARAAMRPPAIDVSADPNGGFVARVTNTVINTGSFEESVLTPGPWHTTAPKATIGTLLPLAACTGAGDSDFQAIGDPSDKAMYEANRRHEDRHASDHEVAFRGSVVPWDSNLIVAEVLEEDFRGATRAAAEAALWARMGGTPDDIADEYFNEALRLNDVYHNTAAGGGLGQPTSPTANADCSTSSAKYTNPS